MFDKWIDLFTQYALRLVSKLNNLKSDTFEEETEEEVEEVNVKEKKFFNKDSILDSLDKLKIEILPIKVYFPSLYSDYLDEIEKIFEKCKKYYECEYDNSTYQSYLTIGVNPENDNEILQKINTLSKIIKEFKKNEFNYTFIIKRLDKLLFLLEDNYTKIMVTQDKALCDSCSSALEKIMLDAESLEYTEDVLKKEEIAIKISKAVYYIHKYKSRCGYTEDVNFESFLEEEYLNVMKAFSFDVEELAKKTEIFKDNKHYPVIKQYYEKLITCAGKYDLNDAEFFERFLQKEKKTYELNYYYLNKSAKNKSKETVEAEKVKEKDETTLDEKCEKDIFNVVSLSLYVENIKASASISENCLFRVDFLLYFLDCMKDYVSKISDYEVYKLLYIFKLKTLFKKKCQKEDLMYNLFEAQKQTTISLNSTEKEEYYQIMTTDEDTFEFKKMLNFLGIKNVSEKLKNCENIFISSNIFSDCPNIFKFLDNLKKY